MSVQLNLTYAEDVEAEAGLDRLVDELVGQTVEADVSAELEVPLLLVPAPLLDAIAHRHHCRY